MNYVLSSTLVALVIFLQKYECLETNKPQVKVMRVILHYVNPKYAKDVKFTISKKNDTYNNVGVRYTAITDFPERLRLISTIYVTNSNYENETLLLHDDTAFLKSAPNYNFLPPIFTGSYQYNKKGQREFKDRGEFRFDLLIPNLDKKGKYYKADHMLIGPTDTLIIETYYCEWGYLRN